MEWLSGDNFWKIPDLQLAFVNQFDVCWNFKKECKQVHFTTLIYSFLLIQLNLIIFCQGDEGGEEREVPPLLQGVHKPQTPCQPTAYSGENIQNVGQNPKTSYYNLFPNLTNIASFYFQLKNFKCGDCGYTCYLKTDLERHIMNVHDKFRSPCPSCGKKYSDLRQHIRVVHEGAKVTKTLSLG